MDENKAYGIDKVTKEKYGQELSLGGVMHSQINGNISCHKTAGKEQRFVTG